jgi:DNA-binding CsgD family transcriptional regulator
MHKQNRNQHTQMQKQREQYENEANKLHHQIQHLDEHIGRLKTEQILREKQVLQLRNRLEQREKLLDRFTAELLPASLNIPDLSAAARNLQQACRTAELSARFDNKLLQRLPPSFERALSQLHPGLSEQDIRLAGYLFLNLPNKEIAQIRSISDAGVSKSRNRLRKKLGLRPEQDLTLFMRSLTDSQPEEELNRLADQILHINHPDQPPFTSTKHQANEILNLSTPYNQHKSAA